MTHCSGISLRLTSSFREKNLFQPRSRRKHGTSTCCHVSNVSLDTCVFGLKRAWHVSMLKNRQKNTWNAERLNFDCWRLWELPDDVKTSFNSMMYPVMGAPPSVMGASQFKETLDFWMSVTSRGPTGLPGTAKKKTNYNEIKQTTCTCIDGKDLRSEGSWRGKS